MATKAAAEDGSKEEKKETKAYAEPIEQPRGGKENNLKGHNVDRTLMQGRNAGQLLGCHHNTSDPPAIFAAQLDQLAKA